MKNIFKWIPLLILCLLLIGYFYFDLSRYLCFAGVAKYQQQLLQFTQQHYWSAISVFMLLYITTTAASIPGATLLTVTGGFLFGIIPGVILSALSATLGACTLFLAVKTTLGQTLAKKVHGWIAKMEQGFRQNAKWYLLFLRLTPIFPFWVVNIVPALMRVKLRIFAITTLIGILPATTIYTSIGKNLGELLAAGTTPDMTVIFKPSILLPLLGLALLSLIKGIRS